jgi:hypothetical protein
MITDKEIYTFPQGFWRTGSKKFINKYEAFLYATENKIPMSKSDFIYFNHVWEQFDRSLIGKFTLKELYKQRAQQLRESYDYLILYFSGGADSYNVLRSFLDNGIKLDEICVKWAVGSNKVHVPNKISKTAYNYLSEWDYAILPVLQEIAVSHPQINIEIVDWFKSTDTNYLEDAFKIVNHWHDIEVPSLAVWSPSENKMLEQGKTVASIYGVDKPQLYKDDNNYYIRFSDSTLCMATPNPNNIYGTEYFYWTPKFPILTFEMANRVIKLLKTPKFEWLRQYQLSADNWRNFSYRENYQIWETEMRHMLYDTWTDRFQCNKPTIQDRSDKHYWIPQQSELSSYKETFQGILREHLKLIKSSDDLCNLVVRGVDNLKPLGYRRLETKNFFVLTDI